jgi:hypothetical protein
MFSTFRNTTLTAIAAGLVLMAAVATLVGVVAFPAIILATPRLKAPSRSS